MSEEKEKPKKGKRFPPAVQYSVLLWYFIIGFVSVIVALIPVKLWGIEDGQSWSMGIMVLSPPTIGVLIGWWVKFHYVSTEGDEDQLLRVRTQLWGTLAFCFAFAISLLLLLIVGIMFEQNNTLPDNVADPIAYFLAIVFMVISTAIAWNTKQRIVRNFRGG